MLSFDDSGKWIDIHHFSCEFDKKKATNKLVAPDFCQQIS